MASIFAATSYFLQIVSLMLQTHHAGETKSRLLNLFFFRQNRIIYTAEHLETIRVIMLVCDKEASNKTIGRKPRYSVISEAGKIELFTFPCYTIQIDKSKFSFSITHERNKHE